MRMSPPSVDDVDRIAHFGDPIMRNLQITPMLDYHEIFPAMRTLPA